MEFSSEHIVPWELIGSALQGNISTEEEAQLQQWIADSAENQALFNRLEQIWAHELNDYHIYREANETAAWNVLRVRMEQPGNEDVKAVVINADFHKRRIQLMRWVSVAALFVITAGAFIWYTANRSRIYQTGNGEQRIVSLEDGSYLKLYQDTRIEVSKNYNQSVRAVTLESGEAFFEVKHNSQVPFIVNMGATQVKDIGTSFLILKRRDSIKVSVTSGKVAFTVTGKNETRELSAGMNLKFQAGEKNAAPVILVDSSNAIRQNLSFANTYLPEVILKLQKVYNKKIVLADTALAQKKFTAHLDGLSFEDAMNILCKSLNIKYSSENGVYYLRME